MLELLEFWTEITSFQPNFSLICMACPNLRSLFPCWQCRIQRAKTVRMDIRIYKNDMQLSACRAT